MYVDTLRDCCCNSEILDREFKRIRKNYEYFTYFQFLIRVYLSRPKLTIKSKTRNVRTPFDVYRYVMSVKFRLFYISSWETIKSKIYYQGLELYNTLYTYSSLILYTKDKTLKHINHEPILSYLAFAINIITVTVKN